jgi:hypothetical protein
MTEIEKDYMEGKTFGRWKMELWECNLVKVCSRIGLPGIMLTVALTENG